MRFGAGEAVKSTQAHIYPVGIHGCNSWLRVSVVGDDTTDCPGLIGPADVSRWRVTFKFHERQMEAMGKTREMVLTSTRHPGINLLECGHLGDFEEDPQLKELRKQLVECPYAFTFLQGQESEEEHLAAEEEPYEFLSEDEPQSPELWELAQDLENLPLVERQDPEVPGESSHEESDETRASHEFGIQWQSSDESPSEVDDEEERHQSWWCKIGKMATFNKGKKRKMRHNVKEIREAFHGSQVKKSSIPRTPSVPAPRAPKKPYKVLEIFTWTMAITLCAVQRGWTGCEPVTLPRWNLCDPIHKAEALQYVIREEPDLVALACLARFGPRSSSMELV